MRREVGWIVLYLGLASIATWPGIAHLSALPIGSGWGDAYFINCVLGWVYASLARGLSGFWDAPMFFPMEHALSYSDHALGLQLFYAPSRLLGAGPMLAYNLTFLAEIALSGYGGFLLSREVTKDSLASFLSGAFLVFLPYRIAHADHLHLQALGFVPVALLFAQRTMARGRWRDAAATALAFAITFLGAFYLGMFLAVVLAIFVASHLVIAWEPERARCSLVLLLPMAAALCAMLLVHLPMARTQATLRFRRTVDENVELSARPLDYLTPSPLSRARAYVPWGRSAHIERTCYLGLVPTLCILAGLRSRDRALRAFALAAGATVVLSLGPRLVLATALPTPIPLPYALLLRFLPGFGAMRSPARLAAFVAVLAAPLAAVGACRAIALMRTRRGLATAILLALHWWEAWPFSYWGAEVRRDWLGDPAYQELRRDATPFAVAEIPAEREDNVLAIYGGLLHGHPTVNGFTSHELPEMQALYRGLRHFPSIDTIGFLQDRVRGDVRVRRVIWRRSGRFAANFDEARHRGGTFPSAPLLADYGDTLVFGLRAPEELFARMEASPTASSWVAADPGELEIAIRRGRLEGGAIAGRFPGNVSWQISLPRGPACLEATLQATSDDPSAPPLHLAIRLDAQLLVEKEVPWDTPLTVASPFIDVRLPARYEATFSIEPAEGVSRRRSGYAYQLSGIRLATP